MRAIIQKKHTPKKVTRMQTENQENIPTNLFDSNKKKHIENPNEQTCPLAMFDVAPWNTLVVATPIKKQPELMMSPSPVKKDLFHQLLGTETKNGSPFGVCNQIAIMEEDDMEYFSESIDQQSNSDHENDDQSGSDGQNQGNWSQQNGVKKRKRKSTNQIKMLKQELDGQMNWSKEKIVKMAEVTGLSQSQVYKWCWDQKKKQAKNKDQGRCHLNKRKLIRKDTSHRSSYQAEYKKLQVQQNEQDQEYRNFTKVKNISTIDEQKLNQMTHTTTQKKVNKRLVFN